MMIDDDGRWHTVGVAEMLRPLTRLRMSLTLSTVTVLGLIGFISTLIRILRSSLSTKTAMYYDYYSALQLFTVVTKKLTARTTIRLVVAIL